MGNHLPKGSSSSSSTSHNITREGKRLQAVVVVAAVHNTPRKAAVGRAE